MSPRLTSSARPRVFFWGPTSSSAEPLSASARRRPGKLLELGLKRVKKDLAALQGQRSDSATAEQMRRVMSFYHVVIFMANRTVVDEQAGQEMKTLAEVLDCLCEGDLAQLGDVAMQRYKALQCSIDEGSWDLAREHEIVEVRQRGLITDEERARATRRQMSQVRLATSLQALRQRTATGTRVS